MSLTIGRHAANTLISLCSPMVEMRFHQCIRILYVYVLPADMRSWQVIIHGEMEEKILGL